MSDAHSILVAAASSHKGGVRVRADESALPTIFNSLRRERQRFPATFRHLVFKRRSTHIDILNGQNILAGLEEIFS